MQFSRLKRACRLLIGKPPTLTKDCNGVLISLRRTVKALRNLYRNPKRKPETKPEKNPKESLTGTLKGALKRKGIYEPGVYNVLLYP